LKFCIHFSCSHACYMPIPSPRPPRFNYKNTMAVRRLLCLTSFQLHKLCSIDDLWMMNWKEHERKREWPNLKCSPDVWRSCGKSRKTSVRRSSPGPEG
jgi:hypothetical protein